MSELLTRAYRATDTAAVTGLWNLLEEHAGGHPGIVEDEARAIIAGMIRDPDTDSRLVLDTDETLVAVAMVATPPGAGTRVDLMGGVHPQWHGRGLGRELLSWQVERARQIHATAGTGVDWEAHTGTTLGDEASLRLYRRFGMTPVRYWFEMVADTATTPVLPLPDGLHSRAYTPEDEPTVYRRHTDAFADHWGFQPREAPDWAELTVRTDAFLPGLSRVAFDGDELMGYVLTYVDGDPKRLYIGQVGVGRPWRRRGVAGALLSEVLRAGAAAGYTAVGLGVDADSPTGAVGAYERVGFTVESRAVTYALPLPAATA